MSRSLTHRLILASASPRRQQLLQQIGVTFEVHPSRYEEGRPAIPADAFTLAAALGKAREVADRLRVKEGCVLAADTIVVRGRQVFGKPRDEDHARSMLLALAGKTHQVVTGVVLLELGSNRMTHWAEHTRVSLRSFLPGELKIYLGTQSWKGKAGGYGIQDQAAAWVTAISGCYYNVVGLPLARLAGWLWSHGYGYAHAPQA